MGILTDFVIADVGYGNVVGESVNPSEHWPTLQSKGVETIKLATLFCAITGREYHNDIQASLELVGGDKDEGPWVFEVPAEMLEAIARVDPLQIQRVASEWASTEELKMDRWSVDDAAEFIQELSAHARKAGDSAKSLYLWLSL